MTVPNPSHAVTLTTSTGTYTVFDAVTTGLLCIESMRKNGATSMALPNNINIYFVGGSKLLLVEMTPALWRLFTNATPVYLGGALQFAMQGMSLTVTLPQALAAAGFLVTTAVYDNASLTLAGVPMQIFDIKYKASAGLGQGSGTNDTTPLVYSYGVAVTDSRLSPQLAQSSALLSLASGSSLSGTSWGTSGTSWTVDPAWTVQGGYLTKTSAGQGSIVWQGSVATAKTVQSVLVAVKWPTTIANYFVLSTTDDATTPNYCVFIGGTGANTGEPYFVGTSGTAVLDTTTLADRQIPSPNINLGDGNWHVIQLTGMGLSNFAFPLQVAGFRPSETIFYWPVGTKIAAIALWNTALSVGDRSTNYAAMTPFLL